MNQELDQSKYGYNMVEMDTSWGKKWVYRDQLC